MSQTRPTALIAEDEPLLAGELREELGRAWPELEVCAVVHDGHAAVEMIERLRPHVLFLDVQMPGLSGLEVARLCSTSARIVFITAFDRYAVQAFEEGAVDYLVKPLEPARPARAVQRVKARLGSAPADLGRLLDRLAEAPAAVADTGHGRMLREMGELLDRCSAEHPLLLVSEDLQWADELTVQLIDYIARRRTGARLMWLTSFRLTEVIAAEHPLATVRHELRLHGLGQEILLDAFTSVDVEEYLAARLPASTGDRALAHAVYERTDGLPLFVADLVDQLVASIGEDRAPASMRQRLETISVPDSLAGIVERYLHELTPTQRSVLEAASVCGRQFRLSTLADVFGGNLALLAGACAELVHRQRWLREVPAIQPSASNDGAYAFRHALHREVLYQRLGRSARVELHRRVKASLDSSALGSSPQALCYAA